LNILNLLNTFEVKISKQTTSFNQYFVSKRDFTTKIHVTRFYIIEMNSRMKINPEIFNFKLIILNSELISK
ncbi:hypothetical protein, partial [Leptospira kirschneri]|uniref:hypothetical protein n=1 Tax=Leptospira kirschneri TaxID=29507 RepID=UPI0006488B0D